MSSRWLITDDEDQALQGLSVDAQVIYMRVLRRYMGFDTGVASVTYGQMKRVLEYIPDNGSNRPPRRVADIDNNVIRARIAELARAGLIEVLEKASRFEAPSFRCVLAPIAELRPKKEPQRNHKEGATSGNTREAPEITTTYDDTGTSGATKEPQRRNHKNSGNPVKELDIDTPLTPHRSRFDEFWAVYPRRVGRKPSREKWKAKQLDRLADQIIADVRERQLKDRKWLDGFIPNPATYLHQERWDDEIELVSPAQPTHGGRAPRPARLSRQQQIEANNRAAADEWIARRRALEGVSGDA